MTEKEVVNIFSALLTFFYGIEKQRTRTHGLRLEFINGVDDGTRGMTVSWRGEVISKFET